MKRNLLTLSVFLFLVSCTSNTIYKKPKDLIPRDTMVLLMEDLLIASSAKNVKNILQQRKVEYAPLVFEKYQIDTTRFNESSFYYTTQIVEYAKMIDEVKINLEKKKQIFVKQKAKQDSISKAKLKPKVKKTKEQIAKEKKKLSEKLRRQQKNKKKKK